MVLRFQFSQANKEFQRAIELNANYAIAHQQYGNNTLSALGRFDDAIAEGKRAAELDPLSLVINADLGMNYYYARRYDEAIAQLRKTLEMDPGYYVRPRRYRPGSCGEGRLSTKRFRSTRKRER